MNENTDTVKSVMDSIYIRRALNDLANILGNLPKENWTNQDERNAVIRGLGTWTPVLRDIAKTL